jgi:hypothetical protein
MGGLELEEMERVVASPTKYAYFDSIGGRRMDKMLGKNRDYSVLCADD